jgi:hypothetical protein
MSVGIDRISDHCCPHTAFIFWLLVDVFRVQYACEFVTDIVTLIAVVVIKDAFFAYISVSGLEKSSA